MQNKLKTRTKPNKKGNYDNDYHNYSVGTDTLQVLQSFPAWAIGQPKYIGDAVVFSPCLNYPPIFYHNISAILDRTILVLPYRSWEGGNHE